MKIQNGLVAFILVFGFGGVYIHAEETESAESQAIATQYFEALWSGNVERAKQLSQAPFNLDEKRFLQDMQEIDEAYRAIVLDKGARDIPYYWIALDNDAPNLGTELVTTYTAFRIQVEENMVYIYVSESEHPKVVGFKD